MEKQSTLETFCPFEIETSWRKALGDELCLPYITQLAAFVERERAGNTAVYPPKELVFSAFFHTPFDSVKVLIMGQDPYHGPGQAHGLSFSVPHGIPTPPSLQNIFKEIQSDLGKEPPSHGNLTRWADQGVLLLNATLTVRAGQPLSHHKKGWESFTDAVVQALCRRQDPMVFILWGKSAQEKCRHFLEKEADGRHQVLTAPHPSPLAAYQGFFGCRHFSKANELLIQLNKTPIDW